MERKLSKICTPYNQILCILVIVLCGIFTSCSAEEIVSSADMPVKVVDGDSLEIGDKRIRLMGIDAPEDEQICKNAKKKKYPCGKFSAEYLQKLTKDQEVICKVHQKDQYDRDLCTCFVGKKDINREMILSGNAIVYLESPYRAEQQEAKEHKRGLWQGRFMQPRLYRRLKEQQKLN